MQEERWEKRILRKWSCDLSDSKAKFTSNLKMLPGFLGQPWMTHSCWMGSFLNLTRKCQPKCRRRPEEKQEVLIIIQRAVKEVVYLIIENQIYAFNALIVAFIWTQEISSYIEWKLLQAISLKIWLSSEN